MFSGQTLFLFLVIVGIVLVVLFIAGCMYADYINRGD
jgi:hypothetical protein